MILPGDPVVASTTVTTGAMTVTASLAVISTTINNFATRFANFEEYRIIKAKAIIRCFSSVNPGIGNLWLDDSGNISAPTATEAQQRQGVKHFMFSDVDKEHTLTYVPQSPQEQIWNPIATAQQIAQFKLYTDNANFGASIVATQYCSIQVMFTVQFRGVV